MALVLLLLIKKFHNHFEMCEKQLAKLTYSGNVCFCFVVYFFLYKCHTYYKLGGINRERETER